MLVWMPAACLLALVTTASGAPQSWYRCPAATLVTNSVPTTTIRESVSPHTSETVASLYLHHIAVASDKYFGTATDQPGTGEDSDQLYQSILNDSRIFGQVTPANGMKGLITEPEVGVFNFTAAQVAVDIAKDHGKLLRCHNLIWASQQPEWLTAKNASWTQETLLPVMRNHIETLILHWADYCHAWDVVNEAFASNGSLSASPWLDVIGPDYVHLAFQYAHDTVQSTGRNIELYYNDYGIESPSKKTDSVYRLVRDLRAQGIQIAIGLESHFTVLDSNTYSSQMAVMSTLQDLGVKFALTELDVRFAELPPNKTYSYEAQAFRYWEATTACMQHKNCEGITVWDFDDNYSWIPETFEGQGEVCLYRTDPTRQENQHFMP